MRGKVPDGVYVTTFCNFAHRLKDGKPIEHECYVLDVRVLREEYEHGAEAALALGLPIHHGVTMRRGVKG